MTLQEFMEKMDHEGGLYSMYMWGGYQPIEDNVAADTAWKSITEHFAAVNYLNKIIQNEAGEWWLNEGEQ